MWKPHPGPQTEALSRTEFEILYGGARGGGKTEAGLAWVIHPSHLLNPKYRFLILRRQHKDLSDWIDRARTFYKPLGATVAGVPAEIKFPNGAIGRTGHLQDKAAYGQYIGHEYHKLLWEELTLEPSEENYMKVLGSVRSTVKELKPQVFCTTNPGNAGHIWVKNRFVRHGGNKAYFDPDSGRSRIYIPSKVFDNPTITENDPDYIRWLKGLPEKLRRAWLDGDWDIFEGQFFSEWIDSEHTYEPFPIPKEWPRFRSIDWGYSDHFCCLWFAVGPDNHIYVYREYYKNRLTDSEYAEQVRALSRYPDGSDERIEYTIGDPISFWVKIPDTGVERYETYALNGIHIIKGDNSRINGWSRIREYLKLREYKNGLSPWVHISKECKNLIRTLPALVHDDKRVEDIQDGMEDHAPDALRLGLQSRTPAFSNVVKKYRNNLEAAEAQLLREKNKKRGGVWK